MCSDQRNSKEEFHFNLMLVMVMQGSTPFHHLGLVVKAIASRAEDPGFESCLWLDVSESSHTSDLKIDIPVAALPGSWCYRVSPGTGWPGVSIL